MGSVARTDTSQRRLSRARGESRARRLLFFGGRSRPRLGGVFESLPDTRFVEDAPQPRTRPPLDLRRIAPPASLPFEAIVVAAIVLAAMGGCGYSFSARTNPHIKTIAVPIFQNTTLERGIEQRLADRIVDAFLADKSLRVTEEKDSDSVILGTIERYDRSPYSYDKNQNVQEYKVELTLHVTYEDRTKNKVVWEERMMRSWGTYSVSAELPGGIEEESMAQNRAIDKAAQDILIKTVRGW